MKKLGCCDICTNPNNVESLLVKVIIKLKRLLSSYIVTCGGDTILLRTMAHTASLLWLTITREGRGYTC